MNNELIEDDRVKQHRSIQNILNDFGIEEVPLPKTQPPMLERSQIYRGKIYDDEKQLIGQRVLCSWGPAEWQEKGIVNLQSGILKKIEYVNGKKYYYVDVDFKDYAGKIVEKASAKQLFSSPKHPYTLGLLNSIPKLSEKKKKFIKIADIKYFIFIEF